MLWLLLSQAPFQGTTKEITDLLELDFVEKKRIHPDQTDSFPVEIKLLNSKKPSNCNSNSKFATYSRVLLCPNSIFF